MANERECDDAKERAMATRAAILRLHKAEEAVIVAARKLGPDLTIALRLLAEYQAMPFAERCEKYGNGMFMMQDYFDETDLAALCDAVTRLDEAERV